MSSIQATPRTVEAIRKADRLMMSTVVGGEENSSMFIQNSKINVSYGNTYIAKVTEKLDNGIFKAQLLNTRSGDFDGSEIYVSSLDMMNAEQFNEGQLIQVTDTNITYAKAVVDEG